MGLHILLFYSSLPPTLSMILSSIVNDAERHIESQLMDNSGVLTWERSNRNNHCSPLSSFIPRRVGTRFVSLVVRLALGNGYSLSIALHLHKFTGDLQKEVRNPYILDLLIATFSSPTNVTEN